MSTALFLFRRDLRLEDNTGLLFALNQFDAVIPAFILTPEQIKHNPYRSDHCLQFMIESLQDLEKQLKKKGSRLYLFEGEPADIVSRCIQELSIDGLVVNRDYTPYSIARDKSLEKLCKKSSLSFHSFDDALLHPPEETLKKDGKPYAIFTPYFKSASKLPVPKPQANRKTNYYKRPIPFARPISHLNSIAPAKIDNSYSGGRTQALKRLSKLATLHRYSKERDYPSLDATSHLSPYLKFTLISPREAYHAIASELSSHHELIRALYWRDFFTSIALFFPRVFKGAFHEKYNKVRWSYDRKKFDKWCRGQTGFPLVDAGMRELNETGFMHNRVRMIAASFLTKDLHIDWRWGEKYFAQKLVDYDPSVNNGNWQWAASTGCDAQPYFRIFNPWAQQQKFDPDCRYIKRWIPELAPETPQTIHNWFHSKRGSKSSYPDPILDHAKEAKIAINAYRRLS